MSSVIIAGDTSGSVTLQAPATAGSTVVNLPSTLGNTGTSSFATTDASGNLGLGVTPSAWGSSYKALEVGGVVSYFSSANQYFGMYANAYRNSGGSYIYTTTGVSTGYIQDLGAHKWYNAASGTAGATVSFTQAMTLDASGNLGIGYSSPAYRLDVQGATSPTVRVRNTTVTVLNYSQLLLQTANSFSGNSDAYVRCISMNAGNSSTSLAFGVNADGGGAPYEAARIDSSGNLLVGTTTNPTGSTGVVAGNKGYVTRAGRDGSYGSSIYNIQWTGSPFLWIDATNVGQLATVSDYRLKENVTQQDDAALPKVMQLNPVKYTRKQVGIFAGSSLVEEGFLAHELQTVIPSSVYGDKDALTEEGEIQPQSLNLAPIISILTKAIQEQQAIIQQLQADVAALKGQ